MAHQTTTTPPRAVIFDLGGTLLHWPDWDDAAPARWAASHDYLVARSDAGDWPARDAYVEAMRAAELAHWRRVDDEHWSGPPTSVLSEGFRRLGRHAAEADLLAALDGYAHAVNGWAIVFPESRETLTLLRERGYRLGLLSNTWWAADWHNADLAAHGLADLLDELVYTSDLPHSKPHPAAFETVAARLGVEPAACVMVGDRLLDDIGGALALGMRAVWRENSSPWPAAPHVTPTATVKDLRELPGLLQEWGGP